MLHHNPTTSHIRFAPAIHHLNSQIQYYRIRVQCQSKAIESDEDEHKQQLASDVGVITSSSAQLVVIRSGSKTEVILL
jgi:hypothetical protein